MARQVSIEVSCDLCGEKVVDAEHNSDIHFGVANINYSIDLCEKHKKELFSGLDPFIAVAHTVAAPSTKTKAAPSKRTEDLVAVRAWAASQGIVVNARGRIKQEVVDAYNASRVTHPSSAPSDSDWEASAGRNPDAVAAEAPADTAKAVSLHDGPAVALDEGEGLAGSAASMESPKRTGTSAGRKTTVGGTRNPDGSPVQA